MSPSGVKTYRKIDRLIDLKEIPVSAIVIQRSERLKVRIPTDDLIPKTRCGRNQHSLAFQIPSASKDVYKYSFFPQTIRDWNDLPESMISSSELSDDSVSITI